MDSEYSQGSVLVCNPSLVLSDSLGYCATSSNVGSSTIVQDTMKIKRKRCKSKQKKECTVDLDSYFRDQELQVAINEPLANETGSVVNSVKEVSDPVVKMQGTPETIVNKPKRVRDRKKKNNKEGNISKNTGEESELGKNVEHFDIGSKKLQNDFEPFFANNKKLPKNGSTSRSETNQNYEMLLKVQEEINKLQIKFQLEEQQSEPFYKDSKKKSSKKKKKKSSDDETFPEYVTTEEVEIGLANKTMVAGAIRINARNYKEAYISSEGDEKDIIIEGMKDRNRALEGDEVVVRINSPENWKANSGQRTGTVVYINEPVHMRSCIGKLPGAIDCRTDIIIFSPRDSRVPRIKISMSDENLPDDYLKHPHLFANMLFQAKITNWNSTKFAEGKLVGLVGSCGDIESETLAIMLENNLNPEPINPVLNIFFPRLPYTIPEEEIANREDLRKECIFTIDPVTARDLDDAVSAKVLDNGNILVGVHISDVSHFLHPNTMLDEVVQKRATTVYLVQRVYHMLPVELCRLCSLTPGQDKLAFSVFLEMDADANVVSHRFARTVIHSCVQFSYEDAQMVIDDPEKTFTEESFPEIVNGFGPEDCATTVRRLYQISQILRRRRFDTGALRIDMPKLCFHLDKDMQTPLSSFIYENKESHRLIEEFMLLANMKVAEHIYAAFPKQAFLRQHSPPRPNMIVELQKRLEVYGIILDMNSAGTLHESMVKYGTPLTEQDEPLAWARHMVLNNLCAKPMVRAMYVCASEANDDLSHYALNAPLYTHFTSPIRRYPDVMVHRMLAASLGLVPDPTWSPRALNKIADICNRQKAAAKLAGEQSSLMFLSLFLSEPIESVAAVIDVKDHSFDAVVREFGIMVRVYTDSFKDKAKIDFSMDDQMPRLNIKWKCLDRAQCVQLFSLVRVTVQRSTKDELKISGTLLPPLS